VTLACCRLNVGVDRDRNVEWLAEARIGAAEEFRLKRAVIEKARQDVHRTCGEGAERQHGIVILDEKSVEGRGMLVGSRTASQRELPR
jgi:hypothetical protein